MSSNSEDAPIWILKWGLTGKQRGRKHMAVFVPNPAYREANPISSSQDCFGTLLQVVGSPFGGFVLNMRRNWTRALTDGVESAHFLSWVNGQHAPAPPTTEFIADDLRPNGYLDQLAMRVRPPRISSNTLDANAIFDCQDWVYDYITYLSQRGVVAPAVLDNLQILLDPKVPLISPSNFTSSLAQPLTSSIARVSPVNTSQSTQQLVTSNATAGSENASQVSRPSGSAPPARGRYTNSEYDTGHKFFKRYDTVAEQWEYRDGNGTWRPWT